MTVVLDTHALLWILSDDPRLGDDARKRVAGAESGDLAVSDITLLEISMLEKKRRIQISGTITHLLNDISRQVRILPIDASIAVDAMNLELEQGDPFDRVIVATARRHRAELVTRDRNIIASGCVPTVW